MNNDPEQPLLNERVDWTDSHQLLSHGCDLKQKIFDFSNSVFNEVQSNETEDLEEIITDLLQKVREVDVESLGVGSGFLARLPMLEGIVEKFMLFMARYEKLSLPVEKDVMELSTIREKVLQDAGLINDLSIKGQAILNELSVGIAEGNKTLKEPSQPGEEAERKIKEILSRQLKELESCLGLLRLSLPRISFIGEVYLELGEKIQDSIFKLIPEWKNVIIEFITLFRQKKALQLQEELIASLNSSSQHFFVYTEEDSRNGLVNIKKIQDFNTQLIEGIETVLLRLKDLKIKKVALESELIKLTSDLSLLSGNL